MSRVNSFPPFARPDATRLLLGSMPGVESLRQRQYYGHPRNCFWKIMGELLDFDYRLDYTKRVEILLDNHIALWDTVRHCVRPGSMDADIKHAAPNNFEKFFAEHKYIKRVFFNGQMAHKLFVKHSRGINLPSLELIVLPSTSPANASISYPQKLTLWRKIIENN
jgi:TDG/mug DNA glycosylase family protein